MNNVTIDFGGYHPLFLPEDGQSVEEFPPAGDRLKMIQVSRLEHGQEVKLVPGRVDPTELQSEQDILSRWGPGTYYLTARCFDGSIYAKRRYVLRDPNAPVQSPAVHAPASESPPVMRAPQGGGGDLMFMMLQMMNANAQAERDRNIREAAERERASREQQTMMLTMMQNQTQILVTAMSGGQAQTSAVVNGLLSNMTAIKGSNAGSPIEAIKAMQQLHDLSKTMAPQAEGEWGKLAEAVGAFLGGMAQAQAQQQQQSQKPTITVAPEPAPPAQAPSSLPNGTPG